MRRDAVPSSPDSVVITAIARTPLGNFLGGLKEIPAPNLGGTVIRAVTERSGLAPNQIEEVLMGCVLPANMGQAPARQAAIFAGLPVSIPCTTVNKVCGSAMKTVMLAHDSLLAGSVNIVIAGGMENMSRAPFMLSSGVRTGYRIGHQQILDHMLRDGLEDAFQGKPMGFFAESCATSCSFTRAEQDSFALTSLERARKAIAQDKFADEIVPVGNIDTDERPGSVSPDKIPLLKPVFAENGTITAANSSSIADGAAAVLLMRGKTATALKIRPIAKIIAHSTHAQEPDNFPTAPISAIQKLLAKTGWDIADVDLFEINEAFAVVALAAMQALKIPHEKLNIHGGACALGHPVGATGARILVTLISALRQNNLKRGIASLCIGGGEATAIAVEMLY